MERKIFNFVGKNCLIKSILRVKLLFYLSFFKATFLVCQNITKIKRNFLWYWGQKGKKMVWISWEKICKTKRARRIMS